MGGEADITLMTKNQLDQIAKRAGEVRRSAMHTQNHILPSPGGTHAFEAAQGTVI